MNFRLVFGVLALCFVLLGTGLVAGVLIATDTYYLDVPLPLYDYYVGVMDNSTYFLVNGSNWDAFYYSSSAHSVIESAVGNASAVGGSVWIGGGDYPITEQVVMASNVLVDGAEDARLYLPDDQDNATGALYTLMYFSDVENVTVRNLVFDGNFLSNDIPPTNDYCANIIVWDSRHIDFYNIECNNHIRFGTWVSATTGETFDVNFYDSVFLENKANGISYCLDGTGYVHDCVAEGNFVGGSNDIGMDTFAQVDTDGEHIYRITFRDNFVNGTSDNLGSYGTAYPHPFYGVRIESGWGHVVEGNTIINSWWASIADSIVQDYCGNNTYRDNYVEVTNASSYAGILIGSTGNVVEGNIVEIDSASCGAIMIVGAYNDVVGNSLVQTGGVQGYGVSLSTAGNFTLVRGNNIRDFDYPLGDNNQGDAVYHNNFIDFALVDGYA